MYCTECGSKIFEGSRFCGNCGYRVIDTIEHNNEDKIQLPYDAVQDIQKQLKAIEKRKQTRRKTKRAIDSVLNVIKEELPSLDFAFSKSFEEKKLEDMRQLIINFPLPTSPQSLLRFAKYVNSVIASKRKEPDALTEVWKEKLKQIYLFAEQEINTTEEFAEIQKYYNENSRKEKRFAIRDLVWFLIYPIVAAFISSIIYQLPWLMFAAIVALGWELFLILYVYNLLDKMIASAKRNAVKQNVIPKFLRVIAWHLWIPMLAGLIVSIVYQLVVSIVFAAILFGVNVIFLLVLLCDV